MPFESDKQRKYLWANKPEVAKQIAYHSGGGYSGNPAIEKKLEEIYNRKMQTTGGKYKGIISGEMNMLRKQLYDQAARDKTARRQGGGGGAPMQIGSTQGEVQDHWQHPTPMDAPQETKMFWDPQQMTFVEGPAPGVREITQTRGDLSGINPMNNTQVKQYAHGGEVDMFNNKGLKKFTQKDRYGNTMTYEFEAPEKPLDPTAIIKHQMDLSNDVPEMEVDIIGMEGIGMYNGGDVNDHPGKPKGTDTVPAWLTPGEFVVNAEATEMYGPIIEKMNNHGRQMQKAQGGPIPRYEADGGWIDDYLLDRLRQQESGGGKYLESPAGALGPYQIMPSTAKNPGYGLPPVKDPMDEEESRNFARNYLMALQERNPEATPNEILQMYNAGERRIRNSKKGKGKPLARETIEYPARVLGQLGGGDEELDEATLYENWDGAVPPVLSEAEVPPDDLPNIPGISRAEGAAPPTPTEVADKGQMVGMSEQLAGITQEMQAIRMRNKGKPMDGNDSKRLRELQKQRNKIADEYDKAAESHGMQEVETPTGKKQERVIKDWNERDNLKLLDEDAVLDDMEAYREEQLAGNVPEREVPTIESEVSPIFGPGNVPMGQLPEEDELDPDYEPKSMEEQQAEIDAIVSQPASETDGPGNNQGGPQVKNKEVEEVGKEQAEKSPEAVDRVKTAFSNAFGKLFSDDRLAEAAIMYLGSRALGYSHAGSMRWTAKNYLQGVQGDADAQKAAAAERSKRAYELAKTDKFTPASVREFKRTGDEGVLVSKTGADGNKIDFTSPEIFYKDGKKMNLFKAEDANGNKVFVNKDGRAISPTELATYESDPYKVRGTKEYNQRVNNFRKVSEDQIKSLRGQFGVAAKTDDGTVYKTDINPATQAGEIAHWAAKNNVQAEELAGLVESAYHDALNDERQDGKKVRDLTPYLNNLVVRKQVGNPDLFKTEDGNLVSADKIALVNDIIKRQLPEGATVKHVADQYNNDMAAQWNALGLEEQKRWSDLANEGENGFYVFIANDLGLDPRKPREKKK